MQANDLFNLFFENANSNILSYIDDFHRVEKLVSKSSAQYMGLPVDFIYQPMFFTQQDIDYFKSLSSNLVNILSKTVKEYKANAELRKAFSYTSDMEDLVMIDPGYDLEFPIARFDFFYPYNDNVKFCELNTDGTSSMHEATVLHNIFSDSKAINDLKSIGTFYDFETFESLIDSILFNYDNFRGRKSPNPNIAIMDFEGDGITSEFEEFKRRFENRGYKTVICDPREPKYSGDKLYCNDTVIDIIYRRAVTARLAEELDSINDFIKAYRDGNVCVVGGLVSQIVHNKMLFVILHNRNVTGYLTSEEIAFVDKYIPYSTGLTSDNKHIIDLARSNKDKYIIKPIDLYAAKGVFAGRDKEAAEWNCLIDKSIDNNYLIQEFCSPHKRDMLFIKDGKAVFEPFNCMLGLFMYNHQFRGIYTRVGRNNIIANISESFTLPNFVLK